MQGPVILSDYPVLEGEEAVAQALATAEELLGQTGAKEGEASPFLCIPGVCCAAQPANEGEASPFCASLSLPHMPCLFTGSC